MEILNISLPSTNRLATDYIDDKMDATHSFFDYSIHHPSVFELRKEELMEREFPRKKLVEHLLEYHSRFPQSEQTISNIKKLQNPNSLAVVGGQQAGLLTGPLYTIHKIISIIKLARQQEEKLGVPVLPVFWIAGEDHDFAEINHLYVSENKAAKKKALSQQQIDKLMVSGMKVDRDLCWDWLEEVVESYGETNHTNSVMDTLKKCLDHSDTFVEFFVSTLLKLFGREGLIIINSGSYQLRSIESSFFEKLIYENKALNDRVKYQQNLVKQSGYPTAIDISEQSANLFYHVNGARILLERTKDNNMFIGKNNECELSLEQLLHVATNNPEQLSNNVVTRPLMQEFLFPTLAFISGPGEIAYWAELKQAFELFGFKMPPVVPRLMITFLERSIQTDIYDLNLSIDEVLMHGTNGAKEQWLRERTSYNIEETVTLAKKKVSAIHKNIRDIALEVDPNLQTVSKKNIDMIESQFDFLKSAIEKSVNKQHEVEIAKFDRIQLSLLPNNVPQERIWNIFYYINKYGWDFISTLTELPFEFNGKHKVINI
mgnify:CR=1 FL=1